MEATDGRMTMPNLMFPAILCTVALTASLAFAASEASLTVRVVDQAGHPLAYVDVGVTFEQPKNKPGVWGSSDMLTKRGKTDEQGLFSATANSGNYAGCGASAPGYYRSRRTIEFGSEKDGRYQPWNPILTLTLKNIIRPIPMYARHLETDVPVLDDPVGFDLLESDWVAPYGHGKTSDMIFTTKKHVNSFDDFSAELHLAFSNKGDGLLVMPVDIQGGSELCSPQDAPDEGYLGRQLFVKANSKERGRHGLSGEPENYFLRVRTVLDDRGQVVSALYGKIYGRIEYFPVSHKTAKLRFTYYLNPVANDRNLEFDPKQNLFTKLKDLEKPTAP
jgi:hypothetical protein